MCKHGLPQEKQVAGRGMMKYAQQDYCANAMAYVCEYIRRKLCKYLLF